MGSRAGSVATADTGSGAVLRGNRPAQEGAPDGPTYRIVYRNTVQITFTPTEPEVGPGHDQWDTVRDSTGIDQ